MINKQVSSVEAALEGIRDGATILSAGFGAVGAPDDLLDGLLAMGVRDLVVVSNNAGSGMRGLAALIDAGMVRKVICSFPRTDDPRAFDAAYKAGRIELELVPQGIISERMRCAAAGLGGFYSPVGVGTKLADGKEVREIEGKRRGAAARPSRRPLGQPRVPQIGAQLQSGDGDGGGTHHRADQADGRAWGHRSGMRAYSRHIRRPRRRGLERLNDKG
jgi:hypothetical protein